MASTLTDDLYAKLVNEEDARVCREIPNEACREVPRNFFLLIGSYVLTKLGDAIANPKTTLTWMMDAIGAPVALTGLLVPVRESGSLIPQLVIAAFVRRRPVRKWVWVVGSLLQAAAVLAMGLTAWSLNGVAAGVAVVASLAVFSLARGLSSVAAKDVLGKTIPKTRRGRVNGLSAGAAGLATLGVGAALVAVGSDDGAPATFLALLAGAAALWVAAAALYSRIVEWPGETEGGGNALTEAIGKLALLLDDVPFRNFVITRALLLCSALSAPYYVILARQHATGIAGQLGFFIIAGGLASSLSAPFWGRLADWSSRTVMVVAALITSGLGFLAVGVERFAPGLAAAIWFYPAVFFVLMIAHSGVRLGRKTYVVDLAAGNRRTDYVAVSNSVIGVVLLFLGGMGAVAQEFSVTFVILALSVLGLAGAVMGRTLPEVT
ncbi:MAG: MFS transporter [Acidobacteriota bacterium]|nr:MFS transporter [Acidobacteriota bacterium]